MAHQSQPQEPTRGVPGVRSVASLSDALRERLRRPALRRAAVRDRHAEGRRLVGEQLIIRSSAAPSALQDAIVKGLALRYEKPTTFGPDLFQGRVRPGEVQFGSGTRQATQFVASMQILPSEAGGSTLTYQVDKWTVANGIVAGIPQLRFLRRRIEDEARKVDAGIVATTVSTEQPG